MCKCAGPSGECPCKGGGAFYDTKVVTAETPAQKRPQKLGDDSNEEADDRGQEPDNDG